MATATETDSLHRAGPAIDRARRPPRPEPRSGRRERATLSSAWTNLASLCLRSGRARPALVEDLEPLQEVERTLELDVLLHQLLRCFGARRRWRRCRSLPTAGRGRRDLRLLHEDVRRDALPVDRAPFRREVLRR